MLSVLLEQQQQFQNSSKKLKNEFIGKTQQRAHTRNDNDAVDIGIDKPPTITETTTTYAAPIEILSW